MSEVVLRSAIERLQSLLLEEEEEEKTTPLNGSARRNLNFIRKQQNQMQVLLKGKNKVDEIEHKVKQIEQLNYQIENVIESSKIWRGMNGMQMLWIRKLRLSFTIQKIKSKMETIIKQIEDIVIKPVEIFRPVLHQINNNDQLLIGLDRKQLREKLFSYDSSSFLSLSPSSNHMGVPVISVYGVVGSGKTTLAKLVYDDPVVAEMFKIRKWIDVPHKFEIGYVLEQIMELGDRWRLYCSSEEQLIKHVQKIFQFNSLIVLDDVRSVEAWETLCRALPKLNSGSYVLVTTRVRYVAEYISGKQFQFVHEMAPLNEGNSWALFDKVYSHGNPSVNTALEGECSSSAPFTTFIDEATTSSIKAETRFEGHGCTTFNVNLPSVIETDNNRGNTTLEGECSSSARFTIFTDEATTSSTEMETRFEGHGCTTFNVNLPSAVETDNNRVNTALKGECSSSARFTILTDEATTSSTKMETRFEGHGCTTFNVNLSSATETDTNRAREMFMDMVRYCDGSPQLIKYLALYLRSKKSHQEWETVHKNTRAFLSEFCCLVYDELPGHLQPCFMHLGHFLEDQSIDAEKLSHLWMIEGLLSTGQSAKGERMMDMTERYLRELALKGMVEVQAEEVPTTKKFKACRFVQGMEKFCVSNCEQQSFLNIIDLRQKSCSLLLSDGPHRLVIYQGKHKVDIPPKVAKTIRSLRVVLHRNQEQIIEDELVCPLTMLNFKEFGVLRILDFDGIDFQRQKLPKGISNLQLLRYLSFKGCVLEEFPSSICMLLHLQVFDLRVEGLDEIKIPNVLRKMKRLNHLYLPLKFATRNDEKLQLDSLTELETLVNFNTTLCKANDVLSLCKLRHLEAKVEKNFSDFESITNYMKTSTSNNSPLQCSIDVKDLDCYAEERRTVLQEFLQCKVLQTLRFEGYIGRLPPCDKISQNLTQLVLKKSYIKDDPMPILEKLPSLGILILSDDAYMGKEMVCSASGFPQLKRLRLLNLSELKRVQVDNTARPIVFDIEIKNCKIRGILLIY